MTQATDEYGIPEETLFERLENWAWHLWHWRLMRRMAAYYRNTPEIVIARHRLARRRAKLLEYNRLFGPDTGRHAFPYLIKRQMELIEDARQHLAALEASSLKEEQGGS